MILLVQFRRSHPSIFIFPGSTQDLSCLVPGTPHIPVFTEESPQIIPVNDGVVDPELVPEGIIFLFDFVELHLEFGRAIIGIPLAEKRSPPSAR